MDVEEVIKYTLRKLPDDHELGVKLVKEIEDEEHPARKAIDTITQLRQRGLVSVTQALLA